jgi:hypothetical protein
MTISNLAIFGDSYGTEDHQRSWTWVEQIKNRYSKVDVYAEGGASLGWIYSKFLNHYKEYDKVIFLFTSGSRLYFPFEYTHKKYNQRISAYHWGGLSDVLIVEQDGCDYDKDQLNFLKQYFVNLRIDVTKPVNFLKHDHHFIHEHNLNSAVVDAIRKVRPDCIIVPCFDHYWKYTKEHFENLFSPYTWSLFDISQSEDLDLKYPIRDSRSNHLSQHNHEWLFNHMIKQLELDEFEEWKKC